MSIQIKGKTINSGVGFGKILIKQSTASDKTATFSKNDEIQKFVKSLIKNFTGCNAVIHQI